MDNENKIEKVEAQKLFLHKNLPVDESQGTLYNLTEEYAKTRKNKQWLVYLLIVLFIGFSVAATLFFADYAKKQSQKEQVEFSEFKDLKLKDLLNASRKNKGRLDDLKQELNDLITEQQQRILQIKDNMSKEKELLLNQALDMESRLTQLNLINQKEQHQTASVVWKYKRKIKNKQAEIEKYKKMMQQVDKNLMNSAKKSEELLNNYQKVQDLKIKKVHRYYKGRIAVIKKDYKKNIKALKEYEQQLTAVLINRFNPTFRTEPLVTILARTNFSYTNFNSEKEISLQWVNDGVLTKDEFSRLKTDIAHYHFILTALSRVSYTNSVPDSLKQMNLLEISTIRLLSLGISNKNALDKRYRKAVQTWIDEEEEDGFILDVRSRTNLLVAVDYRIPIQEGSIAIVVRGKDNYIGKVELHPMKDHIQAKVIETHYTNKIQAFDRLVIDRR